MLKQNDGKLVTDQARGSYLLAVALVAAATAVRAAAMPLLGWDAPFLTFFPAVMVAAYRGGRGPGLLAAVLSAASAAYFFMQPAIDLRLARRSDLLALISFALVSFLIVWLGTQIRRARQVAEEQRTLWLQTLSSIGDGVIATDAAGRISFMNGVAEALSGRRFDEVRGATIEEAFGLRDEQTGEPVDNPVRRAIAEKQVVGLANHTVLVRRDRTELPIDDTAAAIRNESGDVIGAVLVFRDVTASRKSERELQQSREELTQTLESITDAFYALDRDWRFAYVNPAAGRVMKRDASALVGQDYWSAFPQVLGTPLEEALRTVAAGSAARELEYQSSASKRWYEIHAYPRAKGGVSVYFRDISDRKTYEEQLRDREQRLSRLAESNVIGILFADVHGGIRDANDEFLRMIGRTREELRGGKLRWPELTPPEYADADQRGLAEAAERGACTPYEKEYIRPDGTRVPVLIGFVLLGAERVESVAFIADLTERKRTEAEMRRINEDLQHFTYGASHDLKEPLRMVSSYSQLLARKYKGRLDSDADEYLHFINDGVRRMRDLVDALLEYSRAGEVRHTITEPASAELAIQESLVALKAAVEESGAVIAYDQLPCVNIAALHLTQLFQNLIGNAIRYRGEQAPFIHITATADGDCQLFCVSDNGCGIPPKHHHRVFGVFQRLHGRELSGTGLGLATCKRIVERYGGTIWVESEGEGKGTHFWFRLPAAPPAQSSAAD